MSWNNEFFTILYQEIFMNRTEDEINFDVNLIKLLTNKESGSICDFCCGVGDILSGFEKNNFETYGVDFSEEYVQKANDKYKQKNVKQGDALLIDFKKQFDVCINWFSSFGYFDDEKNQQLLNNMSQHTKEGGKVVLEIYNTYDIIKNFKKEISYEKDYNKEKVYVKRKSNLDLKDRLLKQEWSFKYQDNIFKYETKNKIYFIDEIIQKMKIAGFKNIEVYERNKQHLMKIDASLESVRLVFIGEK